MEDALLRVLTLMREVPGTDVPVIVADGEAPRRFEHTDPSDDRVLVRPHVEMDGWLVVITFEEPEVHLDPDAINRLAQYLDGYRTDGACPGLDPEAECAGTRNHEGGCTPEADDIGLGAVTAKPSTVNYRGNCAGCGHSPHASRCREIREPECMGDECGCFTLTALEDWGVVTAPARGRRYCTLCGHEPHGAVGCGEGGRGLHRCTCRGGR